jgi:hypothetical protein
MADLQKPEQDQTEGCTEMDASEERECTGTIETTLSTTPQITEIEGGLFALAPDGAALIRTYRPARLLSALCSLRMKC